MWFLLTESVFVVGPIEPATYLGHLSFEYFSQAFTASSAEILLAYKQCTYLVFLKNDARGSEGICLYIGTGC